MTITIAVMAFLNFFRCFSEEIRHCISCESSARQLIHMRQRQLDIFHVNPLLDRGFTGNIMPYFLQKIKVTKL